MFGGEVNRLPDPDLFRDALMLYQVGTFSPRDLDETDALLLSLIHSLRSARKGSG